MNQDDIFDSLVRNAFDFLERGIDEFDRAPKYSVIHFCAAVEMILKARLMKEHWSLIISKPEQAVLTKFMAGDFVSVTMDEARARLLDIAGENIGVDAFNSFRTLANHRNKMIHFFHAEMESDAQAKVKIVAEQCRSWFFLHRLLNQWSDYFQAFNANISQADKSMKAHRKYLSAKFKALKPDLDAIHAAGRNPKICSVCGFRASDPHALDAQVSTLRCLVCDHTDTKFDIECPHCHRSIAIMSEGHTTCKRCNGTIEPEHLVDALTNDGTTHISIADGEDKCGPAHCGNCDGYHTVVSHGDIYLCTKCFELSHYVEQCEWCNEGSTGHLGDSYLTGCGHCDGRLGWREDD